MAYPPNDIELREVQPSRAADSPGRIGSSISGFPSGTVRFIYDVSASEDICQYVCLSPRTPAEDIASYMYLEWKIEPPKFILSVLSRVDDYKPWATKKKLRAFHTGISKVVSRTEVWLLTGGLDTGVTKSIGDAIQEEMIRRKVPDVKVQLRFMSFEKRENLPNIRMIGIQGKKNISYGASLDGKNEGQLFLKNEGRKPKSHQYDLNPSHSHFLLVEEMCKLHDVAAFRFKLEQYLRFRRGPTEDSSNNDEANQCDRAIPMVGLLIQGGPLEVERALDMLKRKIPVIVFKGSGYAADLIAFTYEELRERSDPEHEKMYVKPELLKRIADYFYEELQDSEIKQKHIRDKILECIEYANQGEETYLTILDMGNSSAELKELDKYILMALFESHPVETGSGWHADVQEQLRMTLKWKRSDLACSQVFLKNQGMKIQITKDLFEEALLTPGCEDFVELFLDKGCIQAHHFLTPHRLFRLFQNADNSEFFITVCLEGILGKTIMNPAEAITKEFIPVGTDTSNCELNRLLFKVTRLKNLVSPYELSRNSRGDYVQSQSTAEAKAINALVYWAMLTYRFDMAKILWKRTESPMSMALIVSYVWNSFSKNWCRDTDLVKRLKKSSIQFSEMAVKLLDVSAQENFLQTINLLDRKISYFANRTVLDIANIGRNKFFIAHHVSQKWLNQRWYGHLRIRQLDWGFFSLPDWLKIIMCASLILPTFLWITFEDKQESIRKMAENNAGNPPNVVTSPTTKIHSLEWHVGNLLTRGRRNLKVPIHRQMYYLWSAPVTKFWISHLFYILFLITFSVALMQPSCGNVFLDIVVFGWTTLIWIEIIRRTFVKKKKYPELPVRLTILEILLVGVYLLVFFFVRIFPHFVQYMDFMTTKFVMSLGLLYFYYRLLVVFLPISPILGPMLINFREMLRGDFIVWLRMFAIVMISGGITIHAVLYPDYPFSWDLVKKAMSRAFFAMFLTKIDDLDGDESCSFLYNNDTLTYCIGGTHTYLVNGLSDCPYSSFGGYFVVIVYLVVTKLILVTLLYALFSATQSKIAKNAKEIWKYQKYTIVLEFEQRLRLPPPFTVISYVIMLLIFIIKSILYCCKKGCRPETDKPDLPGEVAIRRMKESEDYCYWRKCFNRMREDKEEDSERKIQMKIQESVSDLVSDMDNQKITNKLMADRMVRLESGLHSCLHLLEDVNHTLVNIDAKIMNKPCKQRIIHVSSRQSPYPTSDIQRFPVFDKYVPWNIRYPSYDPVEYTRPVNEYFSDLQALVDPDFLKIKNDIEAGESQIEDFAMDPKWNNEDTITVDGEDLQISRRSWIKYGNTTQQYFIEKSGIPRNPRGRTGMRGRGRLWRWGPNHSVRVILSRWKVKANGGPSDYMKVEGKHVLEFIVVQRKDTGETTLPYENDYGLVSVYTSMCNRFLSFTSDHTKITSKMDEEQMKEFFSKYAKPSLDNTQGFSADLVYRGYLDDPSNTDNAWKETEVWNFHYSSGDMFDDILSEGTRMWREASPYTHLYGNQDFMIQEVARIHKAYRG
ncbi:hypothetical protein ScPMuIL_010691 [Solemya velum]